MNASMSGMPTPRQRRPTLIAFWKEVAVAPEGHCNAQLSRSRPRGFCATPMRARRAASLCHGRTRPTLRVRNVVLGMRTYHPPNFSRDTLLSTKCASGGRPRHSLF